ncbi:MAG: hypothetical protein R6U13_00280, partial [Desulfatiglandaceae bacterium]
YIVIQSPDGAYLDYVEMTANTGTKVKMTSIDTFTLDDSQPETFDFDFTATDADGDTVNGSFTLTAQNASTIEGTSDDDALGGGSSNNIIYGYDGEDILVGGEGDDILDGGLGDDTMTGGSGADIFKAGEGHDTIIDYDEAQGDVIDFTHINDLDPAKYEVIDNNGKAELVLNDSSNNELGSVTFDNIDYDGLDEGNELTSLLGQLEIDDGTT